MIGGRLIHALANVFFIAASFRIASYIVNYGGLGIGSLRFLQGVYMVSGILLAGLLIEVLGVEQVFVLVSILCLLPVIIIPMKYNFMEGNRKLGVGSIRQGTTVVLSIIRKLRLLLVSSIVEVSMASILFSYHTAYLVRILHLKPMMYSTIVAVKVLVFSTTGLLVNSLSWKRVNLTITGILASAIGLLTLLFSEDASLILIGMAILGFGSAFLLNPLYIAASKYLPENLRGFTINLLDSIVNLGFITPLIIDLIIRDFNIKSALLVPLMLLFILTLFVVKELNMED